jgi:hypothetical protein
MHHVTSSDQSLVISYRTLRKIVGVLGISFPIVLFAGAFLFFDLGIQSSISSYYHTGMRDVFVGTLCVIGFFLLSYRGHEPKDDYAGDVACVAALMVAFVPTAPDGVVSQEAMFFDFIHLLAATSFFAMLIYFSLVLFTKTNPDAKPTRRKLQRNRIYRICGITMLTCMSLILIYRQLFSGTFVLLDAIKPVYWLEAIAICAFGLSWLTKGRAILNERVGD